MIKAAAVGGIVMVLTHFIFTICRQIVFPPKVRTERCHHCGELFSYNEGALKIRDRYYNIYYACKRCAQIEDIAKSMIKQSQLKNSSRI